jgi:hypothetical protein
VNRSNISWSLLHFEGPVRRFLWPYRLSVNILYVRHQ